MDKYKKIWLVTFWMLLWIVWSLYAAWTQITSLTQSVSDWDIITSSYYNSLNWTKSDWKACKYSWWKLVCIDDLGSWGWITTPTTPGWGAVTTPMHKTVFLNPNNWDGLTPAQWQENVDAYNALVEELDAKWLAMANWDINNPTYKEVWKLGNPDSWYNTCIIKNWKFAPDDIYDISIRNWCSQIICREKVWLWVSDMTMCGEWSNACPKSKWTIACMY